MSVSITNPATARESADMRTEQMRSLYAEIPGAIATNTGIAVILATTLWRVHDSSAVIGWLAAMALVLGARALLFVAYRRAARGGADVGIWLLSFRASVAATGTVWGAAGVLLFPANDVPHQAFLAYALAGVTAGAVILLAIDLIAVLAFAIPTLLPMTVRLFVEGDEISMAMGAMATLFLVFVGMTARRTYRGFRETIRLRFEAGTREQVLSRSEERLSQAQQVARLGSFEWHPVSGELQWSDEHFRLWGLSPQGITPDYALFRRGVHPDDIERLENILQHALHGGRVYDCVHRVVWPDGSEYHIHSHGEVIFDDAGVAIRLIGTVQDITERKRAEETIHNLAFYDSLTNLPNRRLLQDRLQHTLVSSARHQRSGAILFVDLDNFKELNDTRGHDIGDLLLIEVATRLQTCVRRDDTVARLGGDEFVIVLTDLNADTEKAAVQAETIAEKIRSVINQPFVLHGHAYHGSSSIGISLFRGRDITMDELLRRADTAMYQAKRCGRDAIRFYDPATHAAMETRIALEIDLRRALPENQLRLYYQAQVDNAGRIIGAEVLLRWQHSERGLIPPLHFIPLAEENGLIIPIGHWVLETACTKLKAWESNPGARHLQLAVNVSARQFRQPDFVEQVRAMLEKTAINPANLKLELTESLVLDNVNDTITKMQALKDIGVRFSMDDFGTGYSSLAYLSQLPLDQVKIDQSFVRNIGVKRSDTVIVQTIIGMAINLGLNVIAEGVETKEQRDFLEHNGCPAYQGYLFGRPVPVEEFEHSLHGNRTGLTSGAVPLAAVTREDTGKDQAL